MFELGWPWLLVLLPLPILVWWLCPPYRQQVAAVRVPFFALVAQALGETPSEGAAVARKHPLQWILASVIWILLVLALARPQWFGPPVTKTVSARDLMLAVDISGSMDQADFKAPDGRVLRRLDGVKGVVDDFIAHRQGDRLGLILFGTRAYVQAPFTRDLAVVRSLLAEAEVAMAGEQTAIGDAIGLTITLFAASKAEQRVLILLTDGNDTASRVPPAKAAEIARRHGVIVHTIGIGDPAARGENRVDLDSLRQIATGTGGRMFDAADGAQLGAIYAEIDKLTPVKLQSLSWRPKLELFHWPLGAATGLALIALVLPLFRRRAEPAHV
ncbi:vWA domain-containing protein [Phreatobacter stygius]|uniref:VWA domain-containing protein n=1 Tax=Phreatobacter stygius TaxID=1940610 RepID=A0A4D7BBW3_9HYPH|nr:VWA domain-containing protein [Phreatobacter stygius]QCI68250.1 VWA domain-containing protein [Phreatobacter stygius]